jgi:hypothetical protein
MRLCDDTYTAVNSSNLDILANQDHDQAVESKNGEVIESRENGKSDIKMTEIIKMIINQQKISS